jgi:hypothetical protein
MRVRRRWLALPVAAVMAVAPATALGDPVKDCVTGDSPKSGWSTEGTQKGSCQSSHPREDETVKNPGGGTPPGQQPG